MSGSNAAEPSLPPADYPIDLLAAGRLLSLGRKRLIKWAKEGRLPHRRVGFAWFFRYEDLRTFAERYCLECGQENREIEPGVFFCVHCASAFCPEETEQEMPLMDRMALQRIQLFLARVAEKTSDDQAAISEITRRYEDMSILRAYQLWYAFRYQLEGTLRIGLGALEFSFEQEGSQE